MSNERNTNPFWRNVATGVGVAAAGAVFAYLLNEVLNSEEELNREQRQQNAQPERRNSFTSRRRPLRRGSSQRDYHSELRMNITDKLNSGTYECLICLDEITKFSKVASCSSCFTIYHLACIREHLRISTVNDSQAICPTCRSWIPSRFEYRCFCQKEANPAPVEGRTPHCCGGACECQLPCHPGPCNP